MTLYEKLDNFFELTDRGTTVLTEFKGAVATFLTLSYILAVNPYILADSGGACVMGDDEDAYNTCIEETRRQMVVATALTSMVGCLVMGLWANLPIAISVGMGVNAYFAYDLVGFHGYGKMTYGAALTAVLIEGICFFVLSITGARGWLIKTFIPDPIKDALPAAIGAFLAHLGLQTLGVVVGDIATAVTLGGCTNENRVSFALFDEFCQANTQDCILGDTYACVTGEMENPTLWLGLTGTILMVVLLAYNVKSSFIIGIGIVTIISWFRGTAVSYFTNDDMGNANFEYFKKVVDLDGLDKVMVKYDFAEAKGTDYAVAVITLLYVDFLGASGTFLAVVRSLGMMDENGDFPRSRAAFSTDAIGTMFGSLFGMSPMTSYIESAAGVEAGARTGLTAVFIAFFFFLSIFFAPIFSSIPPWATGGSLIIVGALMCRSLEDIHWNNPVHAVVAFVTVIMMPLTYSIAYGLIAGIGTWLVIKGIALVLNKIFGLEDPTIIKEDDQKKEHMKEEKKQKEEEQPQITPEETAKNEAKDENDVEA